MANELDTRPGPGLAVRGVTWTQIEKACQQLAERHQHRAVVGVYPIPRGGAAIGAMVAPLLGVPILGGAQPGCLVVDDLVATGDTGAPYATDDRVAFDAAFRKPITPAHIAPDAVELDGWLVFPWEVTDGATGPTDAVIRLLDFIGEDPTRPGLADTPRRVVEAFAELTRGLHLDPAEPLTRTFQPDGYTGPVKVGPFPFTSMCEHHLLPFTGTATITYTPTDRIVGLSKLPRMFGILAARPQVQERLTQQAADAIRDNLYPAQVTVEVTARHSCMADRGVHVEGETTTVAQWDME